MVKQKGLKSDTLILLSILLLILSIGQYQKKTGTHIGVRISESLNYLPSGTFLKGMALGYDEALADFLWVRTVGYFGTHVKTDRDYTWLIHMLRLIVDLDPRYESPYEFAGVVLPSELKKVEEGIAFLEEGIKNIPRHNPRYWLQNFYLGFIYMIYKNDPIKAAHQFEIAATFPKSPDYLPLLVGRLYGSVNKPYMGIAVIESILNDPDSKIAENEQMRSSLKKRIKELMVAQDILLLEHAVAEYYRIYRQKPSQLNDLVSGLILPFIPAEPFGGAYYLSKDGTKVFSTKAEGRFQVYTNSVKPQIGISPRSDKGQ